MIMVPLHRHLMAKCLGTRLGMKLVLHIPYTFYVDVLFVMQKKCWLCLPEKFSRGPLGGHDSVSPSLPARVRGLGRAWLCHCLREAGDHLCLHSTQYCPHHLPPLLRKGGGRGKGERGRKEGRGGRGRGRKGKRERKGGEEGGRGRGKGREKETREEGREEQRSV